MYFKLKQFIKILIPRKLLFKFELVFRFFIYMFYKGHKYECNICNKRLNNFIQLANKDKLCPYCGSISRNRRLWEILKSGFLNQNLKILDFSPSRSLYRKLSKKYPTTYTSSDISGDFISEKHFDITKIDSEDSAFDLIICYHILEHIENDKDAMNELFRVLKIGGKCLIQTPFKDGEIYENPEIILPEERLLHFGQQDHVRIYSVESLKERLIKSGFSVEILKYEEQINNYNGFNENEKVLICSK